MTIQARKLLKYLKKAQAKPDGTIYIDFDEMTASEVHHQGEPFAEISLMKYSHSINSVLQYLKDNGYIDYSSLGHAKVLHAGWHLKQTDFASFPKFLFKSVLVPIVVSVIAAAVTTLVLK